MTTPAGVDATGPDPAQAPGEMISRQRGSFLGTSILTSTSLVGMAVILERGLGFVANMLGARIGGAQVFGTYSLALTTANNVASYAGAGIGTTANRFSGQYPAGTVEYGVFRRALALVSVQSAVLAAAVLWFAAKPLAGHLLANPALVGVLRLSSFSAAGIILLECLRGFLIGQQRFEALLIVSGLFGSGLLVFIPLAASRGPAPMILGQALAAGLAILVCTAKRQHGERAIWKIPHAAGPKTLDIWRFGLIQLAAFIGLNAAGWWTASLVSRSDHSMVQMGLYACATQLRNMVSIVPGLVNQSNYALLTNERAIDYGGAGRVLIVCSFVVTLLAVGLSGIATATLPWTLGKLYGNSFRPAELAAALAICTALIHMVNAPASSRLTIVSLRLTGTINGLWSILVIALATGFIGHAAAAQATGIFLLAHAVSAILVVLALKRLGEVPRGLPGLTGISLVGAGGFALLASIRWIMPDETAVLSVAILALTFILVLAGLQLARRCGIGSEDLLPNRLRQVMGRLSLRRYLQEAAGIKTAGSGEA